MIVSGFGASSAMAACATNDDCKAGRVCERGSCVEPVTRCTKDRDCEGDDVCDGGACVPPPPRVRKLGDFAFDAEVLGLGLFSGASPQIAYGAAGGGGIWVGARAALLAQAELLLMNGAEVRQVFVGPALRVHRWGAVSGNFALGAVFQRQRENTLENDFHKAIGLTVSSWYEISGPFSFIYGAELTYPLGVDPANSHSPQFTYGIRLGLGWVQQ